MNSQAELTHGNMTDHVAFVKDTIHRAWQVALLKGSSTGISVIWLGLGGVILAFVCFVLLGWASGGRNRQAFDDAPPVVEILCRNFSRAAFGLDYSLCLLDLLCRLYRSSEADGIVPKEMSNTAVGCSCSTSHEATYRQDSTDNSPDRNPTWK